MKTKVSATVEEPLVRFLDSLNGKTRSEKLEGALSILKQWKEENRLRHDLAAFHETPEGLQEREDWQQIMNEAMWNE